MLAPAWVYNVGTTSQLEVTPVVVGGIMYVTAVNECDALDAGTGRRIWQFKRARTKGLVGDAASGINRQCEQIKIISERRRKRVQIDAEQTDQWGQRILE